VGDERLAGFRDCRSSWGCRCAHIPSLIETVTTLDGNAGVPGWAVEAGAPGGTERCVSRIEAFG